MKKILTSILLFLGLVLLIHPPLQAQTPQGINYQAVVRDGGNLLKNQIVDLRFTLLLNGSEAYLETQNLSTDDQGLIHTVIGAGTALGGSMDSVPWESGAIELKVAMDAGGGFVNLGTSPLESVPYSFFAQQVADISQHDLEALSDVEVSGASSGDVLSYDGQKWTAGSVSHPWTENSNTLHYLGSAVGIRTSNPTSTLTVRGNLDMQDLASGDRKVRLYGVSRGAMEFTGAAGSRNVLISNTSGSLDNGFMGIYNTASELRAYMEITSSNTGRIITRGPNDARNTSLTWLSGCNNCGYVGVHDANSLEAGMYVNTSGQGVVFGDVKNFRMEHPTLPGKEIWYASLEGPEAAAYERGTATLVNEQAQVELSGHFGLVAAQNLTVILTPLSGASKGLAVINKSVEGFEVVELFQGQGNYAFDWEIKAVRKGFEDYRVIRDADEARPGNDPASDREPAGIPN